MTESLPGNPKKSKKTRKQIRESAKQRVAKKRALDKSNGLRLVQVSVPEDGMDALREFAKWLRAGNFNDVETAFDIFVQCRRQRDEMTQEASLPCLPAETSITP